MKKIFSKALIYLFIGFSTSVTAQTIPIIKWDVFKMVSHFSRISKESPRCDNGATSNSISINVIKCDEIVAGHKPVEKVVQ